MPALFPHRITRAALAAALVAVCALPAGAADLRARAEALGMVPHKALYAIRMVSASSGSQILNISGQMFYEWEQTCDAWTSSHRFNMLYEYADTAPMRIVSDFTTYEPFDGTSLNYTSQRKRDGELYEELRGVANVSPGAPGKAVYTLPPELSYDLSPGTLFPMGHSVELAEKIRQGKKFFNAVIFDGSDEAGPVEVNAFIGKPVEKSKLLKVDGNPAVDLKLLDSPAHQVRMAFFPVESEEDNPASDYEMTMTLHDNGVISDMTIEYDDFSVSQSLIALEAAPDTCRPKKFNP